MKRLLAATATIALLAATGAQAQNDRHGGGYQAPPPAHAQPQGGYQGGGRHESGGYRPDGGYRPQTTPIAPVAPPAPAAPAAPVYRSAPGPHAVEAPRYHGQTYGTAPTVQDGQGRRFEHGRAWGVPGARPEGGQPRYDRRWFPRDVTMEHRYHWRGYWRHQRGFYFHRWLYGEFLPFGWFEPDYWVSDYWDYDLPVPPYGYAWVRVGDDVLLINLATGFVAETIYGVFF